MSSRFEDAIRSPLSPAQRDFLLDSSTTPGASHHVLGTSIHLGGDVDVARWQEAAITVFQSEPGMRLRLVTHEGETAQAIDPDARLVTSVVSLAAGAPDLGRWVLDQLAARPTVEADPSFVHAVVRDQSGRWHSVLMAPHIFIDGQGFRRFFEQTARVYDGDGAEGGSSVQPLFDALERAGTGVDLPETVEFWRRRLNGVSPLSLRTRTDPAGIYVDEAIAMTAEESAAIEEFCGQRRLHPADFFFGVYALVLERLREAEGPWVIHTIRSTRGPEERELMGCFYRAMPTVLQPSMVALSAPVAGILSLPRHDRRDSRGRLRISMLALQEGLPRAGARAFFNFYNFTDVRALGTVRQMRSHFFHRRDELHLVITRRAEGFELRARFHTSTCSERRLLPRLAAVANQVAAGAATVADCDWLLPDEQPSATAPDNLAVLTQAEESFSRHAVVSPNAPALTLNGAHLAYGDLEAAANRLARRLIAEGVGPGTLVGVHLNRSFEQVAAVLAVLKAGGAFVPIDPDYPEERVGFILADSRVPLLIGRVPAGGEAAGTGFRSIAFDDVRTGFSEESNQPLAPRAALDDLAYVIYTSGSTGRPKGTLVTRRNLASLLAAAPPIFDFGPADTWTLLHSCAFDFSVWETFAPLATGGRLVIVPTAIARAPADLAQLIDGEHVTVLNQTPSAFYHLAAAPELIGRSLRYVVFGGEALEPRRLAGWFARFGDTLPQLVNMYGITETTVHVTYWNVTAADAASDASPIGRPLRGWQVYLADPEGRPVPRGCSGEIWVGGAGVARGYLDRDDLTRDRFRHDRFRPGDGGRVYRSGDLARERADGTLEFLGRIDNQVKIRGYRIELGEVAAVLAEHVDVREALVLAHPGPEGSFLVGYAIPAAGVLFDEAEVLRFLRRRLPAYMTCSRVVAVAGFPLTAHGKLDRGALPVPADRPPDAATFVAPRTATEELVATLFSEATGAAQVGAEDDFFAVGGHSLAAMRVAARLQEVFQVSAGVGLLFDRPTVAQVAEYVDVHRGTAAVIDRPVFGREAGRDALPLTFAQERILLLQRLFPDMIAYHFEAMVGFSGALDPEILARALARVIARHEGFRTTFHHHDGRPVQRVHDQGQLSFEHLDFSSSPRDEAARQVEDLRRATMVKPFNTAALPLIEWRLVKVAEREHLLLHREHHLIHDGWSFVVFLRDLLEFYRAMNEGRPERLPPCVAVGDYAAAHRRWLEGPAGDLQRQYWQQKLAGVPERVDIPTDRSRPAVFSFLGDQLRFDLPAELVDRLRATARREGLTLYMLLLGAFSLVLSRLSGAEDLAIASGVANRRWEEVEQTVGMLVNNVVFRLRPGREVTVREYLREVREEVLGGMANQDLPFSEIVRAAGVQRVSSETPLASIFFSSYEGPLPELSLPDLDVEMMPGLALGSAKFDWNLVVIAQPARPGHPEQVTVLWEYATDLFDRSSVERARRQFLAAAGDLVRDLDRPLADISISDDQEQRFLMAAAEGSWAPYPETATIPALFAERLAQDGTATAIRDGATTTTYAELDRLSDHVAAGLQSRGVAMQEPVAFVLPRGTAAVAVMLGILKAGAAYLPLSPKDPPARHARLIADAGVRFVVTNNLNETPGTSHDAQSIALNALLMHVGRPTAVAGRADALAAIMFTSGSTGQPKGVEVLHRGMVRLLFGVDYAVFGPDETILQLAPLSFDASTFEIWGSLLHGGQLVIFPDDLPSAAAINRAITTHGVTTMWLNGSLFNAIVDEDATALAPLRQLLVGGEALSVVHVERARRALPATTLVNGYGPTENTTFSCCYEIPRDLGPATSIPIGRPIAHSRARLLDAHMRPSPAGAVGEIYVGGDGLARGYRNQEQLTRDLFVPDPFDASPGARLYRTGDLGRVLPDGNLEFLGRRDGQVKIRGHRIEPGEVESALRRIDGVSNASVLCLDDAVRGRSLVAFVVTEGPRPVQPAEILRSLARELPPYLVPARVLVLPALPVTSHGKLDAAALIRKGQAEVDLKAVALSAVPRTALEGVTADVFAEVLGLAEVDPDQDFFAAGGHSVLIVRALAKIERALGLRLEPSVFFHSPSPRQLALAIEQRMEQGLAQKLDGREGSVIQVSAGTRPLFFVPGGEGGDISMGVYARLALQLPGRSFYGLRLSSDDRSVDRRAMTVEAMAASCIADLRRTEPDAAVDLVGGCVGGIVAYEMARQLERAGRPPNRLVLLDTVFPSIRQRRRHYLRRWSARTRRLTIDSLVASGLRRSRQERVYRAISRLLPFPEHEASPHVPPEWYVFGESIVRYRLQPLDMPVMLLVTEELIALGHAERWQRALGDRLTVKVLPGTHWSHIRSDIAESGAMLRAALE